MASYNYHHTHGGDATVVAKSNHEFATDGEYIVNGIRFMNFRILTSDEIQRHATVHVHNSILYDGMTNNPSKGSLLDPRLGVGFRGAKCKICYKDYYQCVGHFGTIELCYPVFHVGYFGYTLEILQSICKSCARVLLDNEKRNKYLLRLTPLDAMNPLAKKAIHKEIIAMCKKYRQCPHCGAPNGTVKKFAFLKLVHMMPAKNTDTIKRIYANSGGGGGGGGEKCGVGSNLSKTTTSSTTGPSSANMLEELDKLLGNTSILLLPYDVLKLFERIPKCDYIYLLLSHNTPMDLICTHIPIPPCGIRPSSHGQTGVKSTEDELTMKLNEILIANESVRKKLQEGSSFFQMIDSWDFLQILVSVYFNSDVRNLPPQHLSVASGQGLAQRLKGKEGRFRANLSGKRVNFSARTVISPDPNLGINEVGIPLKIAKHMTYPVMVTPFNIEFCRKLVLNGPKQHPGAVFIFHQNGRKMMLNFADRKYVAANLKIGDQVLRHMMNGDYVLFNRQPSLHRLSIMCHRVRIHPDLTFKFNECVCSPYNADFDGDEMNVHFMQTEEAKAEAAMLMQSKYNITSPRNGEPMIAPIQDFITSIYLLTQRDTFFNKYEVCQLISNLIPACGSGSGSGGGNGKGDKKAAMDNMMIQLPPPAIIRPYPVWTGKQLFKVIAAPFSYSKVRLNLLHQTKAYSGKGKEMCQSEGYIHIRNSELLSGTLDKSVIGGGSKKNIFYLILKEFDCDEAIATMLRLCRVTSFFITNRGFSIGIDDVTPNTKLLEQKTHLVTKGYTVVQRYIDEYRTNRLNPITGLSREQTLESLILKELSEIRDHAGKACIKELSHHNSPLVMANCGSKGSYINVSQMAVCVGQQSIRGQRVAEGFSRRVLPHFDYDDKSPLAKGFVENSFYSGLNPFEFFFHAMAGREGLLDTAVKTAETGYMQRRLIKGLEDLVVHYDYSVRNSNGEMIQFHYGDDCIDPINIESNESSKFVDFDYYWNHVLATTSATTATSDQRYLTGQEIYELIQEKLQKIDTISSYYKEQIRKFFEKISIELGHHDHYHPYHRLHKISPQHVEEFLRRLVAKFHTAKIDPGTAIGAICAQSIGEPTTQMTLKTFHFTGVASMNITQGVPRITEIINATKNPSTPFIVAELADFGGKAKIKRKSWITQNNVPNNNQSKVKQPHQQQKKSRKAKIIDSSDEEEDVGGGDQKMDIEMEMDAKVRNVKVEQDDDKDDEQNIPPFTAEQAEMVKLRIEKVYFDQICEKIYQTYIDGSLCFIIKLNELLYRQLNLNETLLMQEITSQLKPEHCKIMYPYVKIFPTVKRMIYLPQSFEDDLSRVCISGNRSVERVTIREDGGRHYLMIEGNGFVDVLGTRGINHRRTKSNNIHEVAAVLGIEAARQTIIDEIKSTMANHGIAIDERHLMLLADTMTASGHVVGMTRAGFSKVKSSTIKMASFERTIDNLYQASYYNNQDDLLGASECIIVGAPTKMGTGFFDIVSNFAQKLPPSPSSQSSSQSLKPNAISSLSSLSSSSSSSLARPKSIYKSYKSRLRTNDGSIDL